MATKISTGKVRLSYVNLWEPKQNDDGSEKFTVTLLIPKSDTATLKKIAAAQAEAREKFCKKNGDNALPAKPVTTLHDGDATKKNGDPFGAECRGHMVMTVSSKDRPMLVDINKAEILDRREIYSGIYAQCVLDFYGYSNRNGKGISAEIKGVRKIADGEPLGGFSVCSTDDFDDLEGEDDSWMQ